MGPACRSSPETLRLSSDRPITKEARKLETEAALSYVSDFAGTFARSFVVRLCFLLMTSQSSSICRPGRCLVHVPSSLLFTQERPPGLSKEVGNAITMATTGHKAERLQSPSLPRGGWEGGQGSTLQGSPPPWEQGAPPQRTLHSASLGGPCRGKPREAEGAFPQGDADSIFQGTATL